MTPSLIASTPNAARPTSITFLRYWTLFAACSTVMALVAATGARAETVDSLRLMVRADATVGTVAQAALLARLEARVGMKLTPTGTTRTGALLLALPVPMAAGDLTVALNRLREDRAVLWVDIPPKPEMLRKAKTKATGERGQKLLLRLKDGVAPDWGALAPRFAQRIGIALSAERQIGSVWVLRLAEAQPADRLADLAAMLETDEAVQYADPVLRRFAQAPNDPLFDQQWNLTDSVSGINVQAAWALQKGSASMTVAVVDTGVLPHPDLAGRLLPGYDFISDPSRSRDGDGRDANSRDEGDWTDAGDCGGFPAKPSSWHGTFVAGLLAANPDNGIGIAGVDWNAKILPVRALGHCGGTDEDVFEAMLWASGAQIAGVPPNQNPAKVINLSLGGFGACGQAVQEAIDDALAQGSVVVVAAGNQADDVSTFAPANCSGVITVGAHNRLGDRTSYSNFGRRIDISAPAGDGGTGDSIISLSNEGATIPSADSYGEGIGTSFSAPLVAGTASLMLARNPTLTAGRVLSILQGTTRDFAGTGPCRLGNLCGIGMLDAGLALASTVPGTQAAPAGAVPVVEYYNADLDHYFITASAAEMAALDASANGFQRTGYLFYAYIDLASAPASARPVCRFYAGPSQQINSHFFTASAAECQFVQQRWRGVWGLESAAAFYVQVPDDAGNCLVDTLPVYRFFDNRRDANHRYSIDLSVRRGMINRVWVPEGSGPNAVAFCSPI